MASAIAKVGTTSAALFTTLKTSCGSEPSGPGSTSLRALSDGPEAQPAPAAPGPARAAQDRLQADAVSHDYRTSRCADTFVADRQGIGMSRARDQLTDMEKNTRGLKVR